MHMEAIKILMLTFHCTLTPASPSRTPGEQCVTADPYIVAKYGFNLIILTLTPNIITQNT